MVQTLTHCNYISAPLKLCICIFSCVQMYKTLLVCLKTKLLYLGNDVLHGFSDVNLPWFTLSTSPRKPSFFKTLRCRQSHALEVLLWGKFFWSMDALLIIFVNYFLLFLTVGVYWMNWVLLGTCIVSIALLLIFRETYERTIVDQTTPQAVRGNTQPFTISAI